MAKNTTTKTNTAPVIDQSELVKALDAIFENYEIPDDCIVGKFTAKFDQLKAQVKSLTDEVLKLKGETPAPAVGRIDPTAAARKK